MFSFKVESILKRLSRYFLDPPEFQNATERIYVRPNQPATISCSAIGIPIPEVKLFFGSKDLQRANSTPYSLIYRINKTSADDLGVYTCTATNKLTSINKDITLTGGYYYMRFRTPTCSSLEL